MIPAKAALLTSQSPLRVGVPILIQNGRGAWPHPLLDWNFQNNRKMLENTQFVLVASSISSSESGFLIESYVGSLIQALAASWCPSMHAVLGSLNCYRRVTATSHCRVDPPDFQLALSFQRVCKNQ